MPDHILIIEDEEVLHILYQRFLRQSSAVIDCVTTYAAAIEKLKQNAYDAVVTDLRLTQSDLNEGLDIIRYIKQANLTSPIILTTGSEEEEVINEALALGVVQVLTKPFCRHDFKEALRTLGLAIDDLPQPDAPHTEGDPTIK